MACHNTVLQAVVCTGLVADDSKQFAVQMLQAVVQLGGNEQKQAVSAWSVWLACFLQDHAIGGIVLGLSNYLHSWR